MPSILINVNTVREDSVERIISPDIYAHTVKKKDHSSAHTVKKHLVRAKLWRVTRGHIQIIDHMCVMCARTHLSNGHIWRSTNVPLVLLSTNVIHVVLNSWKLVICRITNVCTRGSVHSSVLFVGNNLPNPATWIDTPRLTKVDSHPLSNSFAWKSKIHSKNAYFIP